MGCCSGTAAKDVKAEAAQKDNQAPTSASVNAGTGGGEVNTAAPPPEELHEDSTNSYRIRDISFFGSPRRILLQSANGPCPLLALCNVLSLRNQLNISNDYRYINFGTLVEMVSNVLFDTNASRRAEDSNAGIRNELDQCLEVLPKLNVGLDVNCKFAGPTEFEYTRELAVFDLLDISLYHGWVVSRQDEKAFAAFAHLSYNQVVERMIDYEEMQQKVLADPAAQNADESVKRTLEEGALITEFMDRNSSQLSYEGLMGLHEAVKERQLAVFFRNSHFSTLLKFNGQLYLLNTDLGFAAQPHMVWERLDGIDGDTSYCDANFQVSNAANAETAALAAAMAEQEQMLVADLAGQGAGGFGDASDPDALLAMQLMQEDQQQQAGGGGAHDPQSGQPSDPDALLAMQLMREDMQQANRM